MAAGLRFAASGLLVTALGLLVTGCGAAYELPATPSVKNVTQVAEGGTSLGRVHLRPSVCVGVDITPASDTLDAEALAGFLRARGYPVHVTRARTDLTYVEVQAGPTGEDRIRLRVAVLPSSLQAGEELHRAVLEHGSGWWGVHRSNLAVLAPRGDVERILAFASKTGLACWGVLTVAGGDDAYVVPGGYREL